jgi:putrescine transport system ATP-binding protein
MRFVAAIILARPRRGRGCESANAVGQNSEPGAPIEIEVYEHPNTRFVAEFLGAANVLPAVVRDVAADHVTVELPGLATMVRARGIAAVGETLMLALRPERLRLGSWEAPNRLEAVVAERAYAGETLTHTLRVTDGTILRATQSLHDGLAAGAMGVGEPVTVSWGADACILLRS